MRYLYATVLLILGVGLLVDVAQFRRSGLPRVARPRAAYLQRNRGAVVTAFLIACAVIALAWALTEITERMGL